MRIASRRRATAFFLTLGVALAALAVAVGGGWILLNWREGVKVFLGIIFFGAIIAGIILNTIFLVREIRRNEQHDSFINAVTHELKTPIASIRLYLQTLQSREVDEAQRREFYRLMIDDTDRLLGTVEQVLRAGKAGVKTSSLHRAPLEFGELVRECVEGARTRHHLPVEALRYQLNVNGSGTTVTGDADELRTAVSNVIENAIKYSMGNIDIDVRIEVPDEKRVRLSVRDQGVGIPKGELTRIFKRFYRVRSRSVTRVKGTGLGLFIVRAIAKKHGGRVSAHSEGEGHGATVTIDLPRSSQRISQ
jgi:two-component system, OmpR family, sensor histidine kinase SenX3